MKDLNIVLKSKFESFCLAVNSYFHNHHEEAIHDLRVGSRRIAEALSILYYLRNNGEISELIDEFNDIRKNLSDVRDTEVIIFLLQNVKFSPSNDVVCEHAGLLNYYSDELGTKKMAADETVRKIDISHLQEFFSELISTDFSTVKIEDDEDRTKSIFLNAVKKIIQRKEKTVSKKYRNVMKSQKAKDIHAFRIAVKKVRYMLEFVNEFGMIKAGKQVRKYEKIQQVLGNYCDLDMLEKSLKKIRNIQPGRSGKKFYTKLINTCKDHKSKHLKKILRLKPVTGYTIQK
jgi:CHAD domain-containing protein